MTPMRKRKEVPVTKADGPTVKVSKEVYEYLHKMKKKDGLHSLNEAIAECIDSHKFLVRAIQPLDGRSLSQAVEVVKDPTKVRGGW